MNKKYIAAAIVIIVVIMGLSAFYLKDRILPKENFAGTDLRNYER